MTRRHRFLGGTAALALIWLYAGAVALACPVCFRAEESPVVDGVRAAVLVMIGVTSVVLAGFVRFAVRVSKGQRHPL